MARRWLALARQLGMARGLAALAWLGMGLGLAWLGMARRLVGLESRLGMACWLVGIPPWLVGLGLASRRMVGLAQLGLGLAPSHLVGLARRLEHRGSRCLCRSRGLRAAQAGDRPDAETGDRGQSGPLHLHLHDNELVRSSMPVSRKAGRHARRGILCAAGRVAHSPGGHHAASASTCSTASP
jgi:hypothetical protein